MNSKTWQTPKFEEPATVIYCFCMDMISSTKKMMPRTVEYRNAFYASMINQIKPHLDGLELNSPDVLLEFVGDGWLLRTGVEKLPALCCLATIMASNFRSEVISGMADAINMSRNDKKEIPFLRMSICAGLDMKVILSNKTIVYVGDSARRANRAANYCGTQGKRIIVCESVREIMARDFNIKALPKDVKPDGKKDEEGFSKFILGKARAKDIMKLKVLSPLYSYTFRIIGEDEFAKITYHKDTGILNTASKTATTSENKQDLVKLWNQQIHIAPDFDEAKCLLGKMKSAGIPPNTLTYSLLIRQAPDYDEATRLRAKMKSESIGLDTLTYNFLISKAPDYDEAMSLLAEMKSESIGLDTLTYSFLIRKVPDYDKAKSLRSEMKNAGIPPNTLTYSLLIRQAPDYDEATRLRAEMKHLRADQ